MLVLIKRRGYLLIIAYLMALLIWTAKMLVVVLGVSNWTKDFCGNVLPAP